MKIGIVGNYGNDNNGDEAILLSLVKQVTATFGIESNQLTIFSNNPQQTSVRYGVNSYPLYYRKGSAAKTFFETYRQNRPIVKKLDLLIIGGGGILMDLYRTEAPLYGSYAMMAKQSKTPYVVYGCGAGPLETNLGKWFIRNMCKYAQNVSVRDPESAALLKSIGVKKPVDVIGDPAFSLRDGQAEAKSSSPKKIGVTAVPYYNAAYWPEGNEELYENYVAGMAKNLDKVAEENDVDITFFATKFPQDANVTKDIQQLMKHSAKTSIMDENLLPSDILKVTEQQDIVIGTRLHSLILATCTETPIMAISYHHKVNDFMSLANLNDFSFPIEKLHDNDTYFLEAFNSMNEDWSKTLQDTKQLSKKLYEEAMNGTKQFTDAIKK
ncbi:polysaccharide pyruvyl transferase family protein [Sporosarcina oncorhynchi]|uniref:Polysaccharide pyruvyl transferase family protein n=1 Tax=Sporosarcina oncorhynchi TaxID=3056444 RepID=A0ABZ0L6T8_9BACL|nr:polysaccharide pyruvyl transferase family protein [Sporosarcina sp. T2O-4]WOV88284.1 polysaccharide pyruvyl transferase family protein [Sporosarcina sp. T2O-4]